MKTLPPAAFALTLLAASLPLTPVQAGSSIQRCLSAEGTTIFTDAACSALGAASRPLSADLLNRIAQEQARAVASPEYAAGTEAGAPESNAVARRAPSAGCARTPTQLAMDLRGSIATSDVNGLAASYHWAGLTQQQSQPIMQRLQRLSAQPLARMRYFDAQIGPGGMQLVAGNGLVGSSIGVMQLMFDGPSSRVLEVAVERYAGCYFIRF